ncbi:Molybdopterin molybdenumtransferase [Corynebacterium atrinae]|uniref:molybdopterin molybdotransferase MoeA n=1 Tax=Corynebacterium atrinae TaxID=1336740 RepID=UPI0025B4FAEA|nr:molybdopterin molybdotransferase MoeA [Corynebacterium atrinae]WJY62285.1 Molybdopterin molybdenumtransferase [Corynebacterium atrinae]
MVTPEEHAAAIARLIADQPAVAVPLIDAPGRLLAAPVTAAFDSPRFDNSQMDGYALSAAHLAGGEFSVGATLPAGTDPNVLYPEGIGAEIVPIMTGAKVPRGTAAIVPVERCNPPTFGAATVTVPAGIPLGQFIRPQGSDIAAGEFLLEAGELITPVAVGVLAGQGLTDVEVRGRHRVILCTGGAEIGSDSAAAIPDSNGPMLQALCAQAGINVAGHVRTNDDPEQLAADLEAVIEQLNPTAIITSGGISAGEFEVIRQVLAPHGWFGHVNQQPGGPQGWARFHGVPVICLPGNPVSTLVSFRLFVAPLLGMSPAPVACQMGTDAPGLPTKEQFLRGVLADRVARPVGGAGSHLLAQALHATCLIRIPAGGVPGGASVRVYPLGASSCALGW